MPLTRADVDRLLQVLPFRQSSTHVDANLRFVMDPVARIVRYREQTLRLTPREYEVLHELSMHAGRTLATHELLVCIWGQRAADDKTRGMLDVYICKLRRKLAEIGLGDAIATIKGEGYALRR
jgi:two-component system cell cycle response regulator CtrA